MSEQNNKIPLPQEPEPVPDFLKSDAWFDIDITADLLDFSEPYRPPRYTMERCGVPFADVGELHIISGKPGHGKTGLMSQLMANLSLRSAWQHHSQKSSTHSQRCQRTT